MTETNDNDKSQTVITLAEKDRDTFLKLAQILEQTFAEIGAEIRMLHKDNASRERTERNRLRFLIVLAIPFVIIVLLAGANLYALIYYMTDHMENMDKSMVQMSKDMSMMESEITAMAKDMSTMSGDMSAMNRYMASMSTDMQIMSSDMQTMSTNILVMSKDMRQMSVVDMHDMRFATLSMDHGMRRMTYDMNSILSTVII